MREKNLTKLYFCVWRPGGASDHKKDFKNGKFRRFAIGAMPLVSLRVRLSQKLRLDKVCKVDSQLQVQGFSMRCRCSLLLVTTVIVVRFKEHSVPSHSSTERTLPSRNF